MTTDNFNISRDSVAKMLSYSVPPGYRRRSRVSRPKLDAFVATIDQWLDEDVKVPRKQRHTAKRVFDRLRGERGFTGGYTIITLDEIWSALSELVFNFEQGAIENLRTDQAIKDAKNA